MDTKTPDRSIIIAFILTILFAGNSAIAVRFSNAELPPFFGAALRFVVAALILFAIVLLLRLPLPRGRSLVGAVIYGAIGTGMNFALLYWALVYIKPGLSMTILALVPLLTFLFACLHRLEAFCWKMLLGALIAVAGIGIIAGDQLSLNAPLLPMLAVVGGAACFSEATIVIKIFPQSHPVTTNAVGLFTGSLFLFLFSALWAETPAMPSLPATWEALFYLILFGSVITFVLTVHVIKHWTASASSYQFVLFPIVTVIVSAVLTKETIRLSLVLGGLLVLLGAYVGGIATTDQLKRFFAGFSARVRLSTPDSQP